MAALQLLNAPRCSQASRYLCMSAVWKQINNELKLAINLCYKALELYNRLLSCGHVFFFLHFHIRCSYKMSIASALSNIFNAGLVPSTESGIAILFK